VAIQFGSAVALPGSIERLFRDWLLAEAGKPAGAKRSRKKA
jgi:hypothetical protein